MRHIWTRPKILIKKAVSLRAVRHLLIYNPFWLLLVASLGAHTFFLIGARNTAWTGGLRSATEPDKSPIHMVEIPPLMDFEWPEQPNSRAPELPLALEEIEGEISKAFAVQTAKVTVTRLPMIPDAGRSFADGMELLATAVMEPFAPIIPQATKFFGIESEGNTIVYLIDVSGSMYERAGSTTRMRLVFQEILRSLERLGHKQYFNIVLFAGRVNVFQETPVIASGANIEKARLYLDADPNLPGNTDIEVGMSVAFRMKPDVILFLTDGEAHTDMNHLMHGVEMIKLRHGVMPQVNAVGFFLEPDGVAEQFLRHLAFLNRGRYVSWGTSDLGLP